MGVDSLAIGVDIEQAASALNHRLQMRCIVQGDGDVQVRPRRIMADLKVTYLVFNSNGPSVKTVANVFDAGNGAGLEKADEMIPVIRRPQSQFQIKRRPALNGFVFGDPTQLAWRSSIKFLKGGIKTPNRSKTRSHGYFRQGQVGFIDQFLGEQNTAGLGHGFWTDADMIHKQATQMALANAQTGRQVIYTGVIQGAFIDQPEGPVDGGRDPVPCWAAGGNFRAAPEAGAKTGVHGCGRILKKPAVFFFRRDRRADRPTKNASRCDAGEKASIETCITAFYGLVTGFMICVHENQYNLIYGSDWPFPDMNNF